MKCIFEFSTTKLVKPTYFGFYRRKKRLFLQAGVIKARDTRKITAAEMKYMRRTAGYTWTDYETNTQIAKD